MVSSVLEVSPRFVLIPSSLSCEKIIEKVEPVDPKFSLMTYLVEGELWHTDKVVLCISDHPRAYNCGSQMQQASPFCRLFLFKSMACHILM